MGLKKQKRWYEEFFENYAEKYDGESFTQGTLDECDFIEQELNYNKVLKILDVGCGTGRHSIELAKRGYKITGIDLSEAMLKRAKDKASRDNLNIDFYKYDARNLPFKNAFDVAIMLCEGGFPLMETDEMNFVIIKNVTRVLKEKGKFIFTTLNGLFPLYYSVEKFCTSQEGEEEKVTYKSKIFDLMAFRNISLVEFEDVFGNRKTLKCNERYYVPSEISWLLKLLGYKKLTSLVLNLVLFLEIINLPLKILKCW